MSSSEVCPLIPTYPQWIPSQPIPFNFRLNGFEGPPQGHKVHPVPMCSVAGILQHRILLRILSLQEKHPLYLTRYYTQTLQRARLCILQAKDSLRTSSDIIEQQAGGLE